MEKYKNIMDKAMLKMTRTQLRIWNKEALIVYLFNGNLDEGIAQIELNTMRWRYERAKSEFATLAREKYEGDKGNGMTPQQVGIEIAKEIERR
jgi:hypothetical protein